MSRYKAYQEYKDSGVEWLGEIPPHWHSRQLKYLCSYNDEVLSETVGDDFEIEYVDIGSISAIDGISGTETLLFGNAPSRARRIVRDGDILISTVRTYLEAIASVKAPPNNLIASTGFAVIRPNVFLNKGYAAYCLRASGFIKEVVARSVGVSYPAINASDLVNIKTPEPSPTEQENIAAFLDHETAKIDALIEKQQRLIELLKEKRQAVISRAVTKGLNPNASLKDSGVEWLGEVPAHWNTQKLAWRFTAKKGSNAAQLTKEFCASIEGEHPVYSGQTENSGVMACIDSYEFDAGEEGYLFSTTVGAKAMTVMHITGKFSLSQNCMVIIPCTAYSIPRFYYYHFQPLFSYERGLIPEHMQASFRMEDLYQYKVLEPPKSEQIEIANFLDVNTAVFDDLISREGLQKSAR